MASEVRPEAPRQPSPRRPLADWHCCCGRARACAGRPGKDLARSSMTRQLVSQNRNPNWKGSRQRRRPQLAAVNYRMSARKVCVLSADRSADSGGHRNTRSPISSIGFMKASRLRGRSLSSWATQSRSSLLCTPRSRCPWESTGGAGHWCFRWCPVARVSGGLRGRCRYRHRS